jgi:hypothetical protein
MTETQAADMLALLQAISTKLDAVDAFLAPAGGIGSFLIALGLLLSFAHGFKSGTGNTSHAI